jgi:hypothetical protein
MKLSDVLVLSFCIVFFVIGLHQTVMLGLASSYWALMLALALFFVYTLRKKR